MQLNMFKNACTFSLGHDTQHDHVIFQVSRAFLSHSSHGPGFFPCCTVLSIWCSSFVGFRGQSLWGLHAGPPSSGPLSFKLLAVRSSVTSWEAQLLALYPVQDGNPTLRHKCDMGAGVSFYGSFYGSTIRLLGLQQCFNLNSHCRMQALTKALAAMGWGGKGKGSSWNATPWSAPWSAPAAAAAAPAFASPTFVPQEEGPGATKFAYSLLYKEREKMREILEEQRKKEEKQERDQEFQKLRQELLANTKQPSTEDSIYRTMIADNPEKKQQAESPEQDNKGMFGTMLKMMRAMTGSKDSKDHTPTVMTKKKR